MKKLDQNNFEIFHQKRKTLSKEEIINLFYNYKNSSFYNDIQESNYKKIEKLMNKYPELPWMRENPFYDYDSI